MCLHMNKLIKNSFIKYILKIGLLLTIFFNCSHMKFRNGDIIDKILSLESGDLISLELVDNTCLEGIFISQAKCEIVIGILEDGVMNKKSIKINTIYKIMKQGENKAGQPKTWVTIFMFIALYGLLALAGYLSGIGKLGA